MADGDVCDDSSGRESLANGILELFKPAVEDLDAKVHSVRWDREQQDMQYNAIAFIYTRVDITQGSLPCSKSTFSQTFREMCKWGSENW